MTTIQISKTYSKGVTLKSVNQAGRDFSSALQRDITASSQFDLTNTLRYTPGENGRLCLGNYTYVWNEGPALSKGDQNKLITYQSVGTGSPQNVTVARVVDNGGLLCAVKGLPQIDKARASELLSSSDNLDLAIQKFNIVQLASDLVTRQGVYQISFTIGTNDQKAIDSTNDSCVPPAGADNNFDFCAVNQFRFTARTAGGPS